MRHSVTPIRTACLLAAGVAVLSLSGSWCSKANAQTLTALTTFGSNGWLAPGSNPYVTTDNSQRGLGWNPVTKNIVLPSRSGGNFVAIINGTTGIVTGTLNTTGVAQQDVHAAVADKGIGLSVAHQDIRARSTEDRVGALVAKGGDPERRRRRVDGVIAGQTANHEIAWLGVGDLHRVVPQTRIELRDLDPGGGARAANSNGVPATSAANQNAR